MYDFVERNLRGSEIYGNVLQLYQFQMSNSSYIFIKEPYSQSVT
jgi:hypothetical protein